MKKFDLEAALRGEPVCDADRCYVPLFTCTNKNIKTLLIRINGQIKEIDHYGNYAINGVAYQLYMDPQKKTVFVNLYEKGRCYWYESEEIAKLNSSQDYRIASSVPVEIEV